MSVVDTIDIVLLARVLLALVVAIVLSFAATPFVKKLANRLGAIDIPKDGRRMHDHPIPRMGGLAVFLGFLVSVLAFAQIDTQIRGMLIGCTVIVFTGIIDDIRPLQWWVKLLLQLAASVIAVLHGIEIEVFTNPIFFLDHEWLILGWLSIPITIVWIIIVTNSVNLIDGLDGLAVGVSAIDSVAMLIVVLLVSEGNVAIIMAALAGACIGFIPYNLNPAKIFVGDTGALLLGYILATMSVIGLFKTYALISFLIPFLLLALPLFDTLFAIVRRLLKGQSPMHADRGHVHHRLIDNGFNQKQAVAILYCVSAVLGFAAVVMSTGSKMKLLILALSVVAIGAIVFYVRCFANKKRRSKTQKDNGKAPEI